MPSNPSRSCRYMLQSSTPHGAMECSSEDMCSRKTFKRDNNDGPQNAYLCTRVSTRPAILFLQRQATCCELGNVLGDGSSCVQWKSLREALADHQPQSSLITEIYRRCVWMYTQLIQRQRIQPENWPIIVVHKVIRRFRIQSKVQLKIFRGFEFRFLGWSCRSDLMIPCFEFFQDRSIVYAGFRDYTPPRMVIIWFAVNMDIPCPFGRQFA